MAWRCKFLPAVLLASLLLLQGAWAQTYPGPLNSSNYGTKPEGNFLQPWQPCLTPEQAGVARPLSVQGGQSSQTVIGRPLNKPLPTHNPKNTPVTKEVSSQSGSLAPSFGKYGLPSTQNRSLPTNSLGPGRLLNAQGSSQSGDYGSSFLNGYLLKSVQNHGMGLETGGPQSSGYGSSFLDGYLLRSLQGQEIGMNKAPEENQAKDDVQPKAKGAF
jgi:hypothetical protein